MPLRRNNKTLCVLCGEKMKALWGIVGVTHEMSFGLPTQKLIAPKKLFGMRSGGVGKQIVGAKKQITIARSLNVSSPKPK